MEVSLDLKENLNAQSKGERMTDMVAKVQNSTMNVNNMKVSDSDYIKTMETLTKIFSQKDLLMQSLILFFKERKNLNKVVPVITGKSQISLRILDWFVTNYSKKKNVNYVVEYENKKKGTRNFIVYLAYKA